MADVFRYVSGETNPIMMQVASATVIEIGDLVYQDSSTKEAKPAGDLAWNTDLATTQEDFHDVEIGVAMQKSRDGDTNDIRVATSGRFRFACAAATFDHGDLVGPDDNAGGTALLSQQVIAVATANLAIGHVSERFTANRTEVEIELASTIMTGGVQAAA